MNIKCQVVFLAGDALRCVQWELIYLRISLSCLRFTLFNKFLNFCTYVYVLKSLNDLQNYTGYTKNLKIRFEQHQNGTVESTFNRKPFKLIYYEACLNQQDATTREKYLKTIYGKRYLKNRLKSYLTG